MKPAFRWNNGEEEFLRKAMATSPWQPLAAQLQQVLDQRDFAMGEIERLKKERDEARGAMAAQDKRMEAAGKLCGVPFEVFGCDWPDWVAEELIAVTAERDEAREEAERLRESLRCILNPQCAVEEAAK